MQCAITPNRRGKPCVAYSLAIASLSGSVTYSISRLWYLPPMAFRASLISFKACCEKYIYPFRRAYLTRLVTGFLGVSSRSRHPDVETNRRHNLHGPVLRIRSPTVTMAPTCRWRSRPQHHKRTYCLVVFRTCAHPEHLRRIRFLPIALSRGGSRHRSRPPFFRAQRVQQKPARAATQKGCGEKLSLVP